MAKTDDARGKPDLGGRRRLWIRLLVSPLSLVVVVGLIWIHEVTGHPWTTDLLLALAGAGGAMELAKMFRVGGVDASVPLAALGAGLLAGVGLFAPESAPLRMTLRALLPALFLFVVLGIRLVDLRREAGAGIAATVVPLLYVGLPLSLAHDIAPPEHLARWLVYVLVVAKASDIGGWLIGKPFGRHKLIPAISPKKSWEGLLGGLVFSVAAALFLAAPLGLAAADWSFGMRTLYGLVLGGASVFAGLTQSGWKRRFGVKDSSTLIPEIGGVLDMVDSMLLAVPAAWIWVQLMPGSY